MEAEIITIGDEILIGQIVDTNSSYIAQKLNGIGVIVVRQTSIADNKNEIIKTIDLALKNCDLVVATGGLGPTKDDITKQTLAEYFGNGCMKIHEPSLHIIKKLINLRNIPLTENNAKQAELPECCTPIINHYGTAPAMLFKKNGKILISMPGVPFEMKKIMEDVLQIIKTNFKLKSICHKTLLTYGIPESVLSNKICEWENALPQNLHLAYLPNPESGVRLRLSAYENSDKEKIEREMDNQFNNLKQILKEAVYGENDETLSTAVGKLLFSKKSFLATAESCTGGHIASMITSNSGASAYFTGSIVAYSNNVKINNLGVNANDIATHGAVSRQVVEQMAQGARKALNADYAIATSGIAGPDGGTTEKPVGTVWIAVATPKKTIAKKYQLSLLRDVNISRASAIALNMLRLELLEH